jgi:ATP-dependent DNA ligase
MLAVRLEAEKFSKFFDHPDYVAQEKLKGIRAWVVKDGNRAFIWTRGGHEVGKNFPHILRAVKKIPVYGFILDGELWKRGVEDEVIAGLANREYIAPEDSAYVEFWAFDILGVHDQFERPPVSFIDFSQRTRITLLDLHLRAYLDGQGPIYCLDWVYDNHEEFLLSVWRNKGEGIMLKNMNSPYIPGTTRRRNHWWKIKATEPYDVVVMDTKPGNGKFEGLIGAFQYGMYLNVEGRDVPVLIPLGYCAGINDEVRKSMTEHFGLWKGQVVEVIASGQDSNSFALIEPRFNRVRTDKRPEECLL